MKNNFKIIILGLIFLIICFYLYRNFQKREVVIAPAICNKISEKQALEIVKDLPEVKDFLKLNFPEGNKPFVDIDHKTKSGSLVVHVYEVARDDPDATTTHTATMNWYTLDSCTGKVRCSFSIYENSKFIRTSEESEANCE